MAPIDERADPLLERVTNNREYQVDEKLARELMLISYFRQVAGYLRVLSSLFQDRRRSQTRVVWAEQIFDGIALDN